VIHRRKKKGKVKIEKKKFDKKLVKKKGHISVEIGGRETRKDAKQSVFGQKKKRPSGRRIEEAK
jgi:hypothetical protein